MSLVSRAKVQAFGGFLTNMVLPNIGAFIAWGFITALFIPTGWLPNTELCKLVGPMITYLLPLLIGYTGGQLIGGQRGAVMGAIGTMGVIVGASIPMFLGAMIIGPIGGWIIKKFDKMVHNKIPAGFEMVVNNFSLGILGMLLCLLAFAVIGPVVSGANDIVKHGIEWLVSTGYLPLLSIINEPAKVLFLNNAIDQGIYYPLGMQQAAVHGKSLFFMVASNPGPGLGVLLAYAKFGTGLSRRSAPSAIIIHFFGGIHEIYFPYILMKPILIIAMIVGAMCGIMTFGLLGGGLVAGPSPGSIFSYLALTPKGGFFSTIAGVTVATIVSFLIASLILKLDSNKSQDDNVFTESATASKKMKAEGAYRGSKESIANEGIVNNAIVSNKDIKFIVFACDAGMGSSAMGATTFRKKIKDAHLDIQVEHSAIEHIPETADLVITHQSLSERARNATDAKIITINNFLGDPSLIQLLEDLKKIE